MSTKVENISFDKERREKQNNWIREIFNDDPKNSAERMIKITEQLKKIYNLPEDVIEEVRNTLSEVYRLEEQKQEVPKNETIKAANNIYYKPVSEKTA